MVKTDRNEIARERLSKLIECEGLNADRLAEICGYTRQQIHYALSGRKPITAKLAIEIATNFPVDALYIMGEERPAMENETTGILKATIHKYGAENQENMCIEECAELIHAINKKHRGKPHNIAEEIADVEIVLEQVKMINGCYGEVDEIKKQKLARLSDSIKEQELTRVSDSIEDIPLYATCARYDPKKKMCTALKELCCKNGKCKFYAERCGENDR